MSREQNACTTVLWGNLSNFFRAIGTLGVDNIPLQCLYTDVCSMRNQNQKSACSHWTMTLLGPWRHSGMAHMTGVQQWRALRKGSVGRQWGWVVFPVMESSWNAWSSALRWVRSQKRDNRGRLVGRPTQSALVVGICYRPPDQKKKVDEVFFKHLEEASHSQTLGKVSQGAL